MAEGFGLTPDELRTRTRMILRLNAVPFPTTPAAIGRTPVRVVLERHPWRAVFMRPEQFLKSSHLARPLTGTGQPGR